MSASTPRRPTLQAHAGSLRVADVFPATRLLGRCSDCRQLIFDRDPHEWATRTTGALCWPYDPDAALFCGRCSDDRPDTTTQVSGLSAP